MEQRAEPYLGACPGALLPPRPRQFPYLLRPRRQLPATRPRHIHNALPHRSMPMSTHDSDLDPAGDLLARFTSPFGTILADPPWRFSNSTGKIAPEHKRLARYATM